MAKPLGDRLPEELLRAFDGSDLEAKIGPAHLLVTTDPDGTPRPCMLSAGELLAPAADRLRVILWPGSGTGANLARGDRVLLCYVTAGTVLYVKGTSRALGTAPGMKLERFEIAVEAVESDLHAGMPVTAGIAFGLDRADPAQVARGWRQQLDALRAP